MKVAARMNQANKPVRQKMKSKEMFDNLPLEGVEQAEVSGDERGFVLLNTLDAGLRNPNGDLVVQAYDLAVLFIDFQSMVHGLIMYDMENDVGGIDAIGQFFLHLIMDHSTPETFAESHADIQKALAQLTSVDAGLGARTAAVVGGVYTSIITNSYYADNIANVVLQIAWMTAFNSYVDAVTFTDEGDNQFESRINHMYSHLPVLSLLCSQNPLTYRNTSREIQVYFNHVRSYSEED